MCSEPFDAMLPLLSPVLDFAAVGGSGAPGVDTPESPDSLASGSDTMVSRRSLCCVPARWVAAGANAVVVPK